MVTRCAWVVGKDQLYLDYHDKEWGVPVYEDRLLFEMLCLEGAQAGLSWWTILQKRNNYRQAFDNFEAEKIIQYNEEKIQSLREDSGIVRNRLKILSVLTNAHAFLKIQKEHGSFSNYIWSFVNDKPIINHWSSISEVPAFTELSDTMGKRLKKDGFVFVGSKVCYSYMQAVGMINDHTVDCHCHPSIEKSEVLYNN